VVTRKTTRKAATKTPGRAASKAPAKAALKRSNKPSSKPSTEPSTEPKVTSSTERILAIDVGGTGLKAAIIDADGNMKTERLRVATPHPCTPDQLVDALAKLVAPLVEQEPPTLMSIGFPGVVRNNRILTAPHFGVEGWHDIPLADSLAQRWAACRCA
jgi:Transcriptional regulator/sugar kinase